MGQPIFNHNTTVRRKNKQRSRKRTVNVPHYMFLFCPLGMIAATAAYFLMTVASIAIAITHNEPIYGLHVMGYATMTTIIASKLRKTRTRWLNHFACRKEM